MMINLQEIRQCPPWPSQRDCKPDRLYYWRDTERILNLNILLLPTNEAIVRNAQSERQQSNLLTNDSMILSCMRNYGITLSPPAILISSVSLELPFIVLTTLLEPRITTQQRARKGVVL